VLEIDSARRGRGGELRSEPRFFGVIAALRRSASKRAAFVLGPGVENARASELPSILVASQQRCEL